MTDNVEGKNLDIAENIKEYPEGVHDDQVDASPEGMFDSSDVIRKGTRFTVGFNVVMIVLEALMVLTLLASPILVGYLAWTWFPILWGLTKGTSWVYLFFFVIGLPVLAAYIMGGVGIYSLVSAFISTIKVSLGIIKDRSK